jgi:general secretion pathway protein K
MTALAVDLAYATRVSVQMAANARDELRAEGLARSAMGFARLVLHFQAQLDGPAAGGARPGVASPLASLGLSLRLWEIVPVTPEVLSLLGSGPSREAGPSFGAFPGSFSAQVEDEDRKVNVRQFDGLRPFHAVQTARLAELVKDPRWDFLFDREDANGIRVTRPELFSALKDWIDIDETGASYVGGLQVFEPSYGDENATYDRLADRYRAKNAPLDSLEELYLVAGVSDAFMAAFGDRLTVFPDVSATVNVNSDDPREILLNAVIMGGGLQPAMLDPTFLDRLRATLALARPLPFLVITPVQFAQALQANGVRVAPEYQSAANTGVTAAFGSRSTTFRIRASGVAGPVRRTIEAVVLFDRRALGLDRDLGRLVHWHEE